MNKVVVEKLEKIKEVKAPEWAVFVKTGVGKERPPVQSNWWTIRAASVLGKVQKYGPIGANRLAKHYGARKNRGHKTDTKEAGSRNIARKILQQLEKAGLIKQVSEPSSGKVITKAGRELLKGGQ